MPGVRMIRLVSGVLALAIATEGVAIADGPRGAASVAEALFDEGVALLAAGDYARACPKLEESQRIDPGGGTLLNLAKCYEGQKRWASAWATYREALGVARTDGRADRVKVAEAGLASVEPKLARVALVLKARPEGLAIAIDGVTLGPAAWDAPSPVDPGVHTVTARAPGHREAALQVEAIEGETRDVVVPDLARDAAGPVPSTTTTNATTTSTRSILGIGLGATGTAALVGGAILGVLALDADATAESVCPGTAPCRDPRGLDASDRAHAFGTGATVSLVAGSVLLVTGLVLWLTAPSR